MNNATSTLALRQPQAKTVLATPRPTAPPLPLAPPAVAAVQVDAWTNLARQLRNPDLELDADAFAGVWQAFQREKRAGRIIDPVLSALLGLLQRQCLLTDDGVDDTAADAPRRDLRSIMPAMLIGGAA